MCDNCSSHVEYVEVDVTEDCKAIADAVRSLCGQSGRWGNNFTLNHFVDIFKGSEIKKIMEAGKAAAISLENSMKPRKILRLELNPFMTH